jgi:hypothetical protein
MKVGYQQLGTVEFVEVLVRVCIAEFSMKELDGPVRVAKKLDMLLASFSKL